MGAGEGRYHKTIFLGIFSFFTIVIYHYKFFSRCRETESTVSGDSSTYDHIHARYEIISDEDCRLVSCMNGRND